MIFLSLFLLSFFIAFWFKRELKQFPNKINQQIFKDLHSLVELPFNFSQLLENSALKSKQKDHSFLFFILFPISTVLFYHHSLFIIAIVILLIYLSLLDYHYYLTDSYYVAMIFFFSLCELLFFQPLLIELHLTTLIFITLFFALFIPITEKMMKKNALGSGDVILFIALSPLFSLTEMLSLLLFSSLFGLCFSSLYWLINRKKLIKLPFIPFISLACVGILML
ncbi:MAG: peptidase [Pasteurellaceae bacterium]|nr:peptidase [Pasteurellaceae bacterium]